MNIGKSFKIAEALLGIDAKEIQKRTGFSIAKIYRIRSAVAHGSTDALPALAEAFEMKVSEFIALGESDVRHIENNTDPSSTPSR